MEAAWSRPEIVQAPQVALSACADPLEVVPKVSEVGESLGFGTF